MGEDEFNSNLDDVMWQIHLNTNVIDDDNSKMAIHHDPSTPTPALACGSTNFLYRDDLDRWIPKNRGGRLFLVEGILSLEYSPRDVCLFDGNILHGLTKMKPLCGGDASARFHRFSIILFSRYKRSQRMLTHGWNRT